MQVETLDREVIDVISRCGKPTVIFGDGYMHTVGDYGQLKSADSPPGYPETIIPGDHHLSNGYTMVSINDGDMNIQHVHGTEVYPNVVAASYPAHHTLVYLTQENKTLSLYSLSANTDSPNKLHEMLYCGSNACLSATTTTMLGVLQAAVATGKTIYHFYDLTMMPQRLELPEKVGVILDIKFAEDGKLIIRTPNGLYAIIIDGDTIYLSPEITGDKVITFTVDRFKLAWSTGKLVRWASLDKLNTIFGVPELPIMGQFSDVKKLIFHNDYILALHGNGVVGRVKY